MEMASCSMATQNQTRPENAFHQLASPSASALTNKFPCDIFINHRGCDVKHTLATTIYHTFDRMGLRVFLDEKALEPGDVIPAEIQQAMTSASLHIAIFSRNYAQSPWCLAELSFMLKTGNKIIPIFYNVQPSDLRWVQGKGIYVDAFSKHQENGRYTSEKLEEWQRALYDISFHSGYVVTNNEDEGRLLKNIVNCALGVLKKVPLEAAKHPVGLDELVQDFEETTRQSAQSHQNAKIVGIVGMGGGGKTTLAKELFNKRCSSFDRCSFVFEVRDAAYKNALHNKQKKLLEDLGLSQLSIDNVEEGKGILSNRLSSARALIILDDVDHIDQLDALLPNATNLGSDSLVIVTSRELGVLTSWGISCNYHMPEMNRSHAKQLFCWHAFLQPSPPAGFESLVEKFLMACNGLPLSLKVLGGQLYGKKSQDYWKSQFDKISRILPADITHRLRISYDALDEEEKEIFLDVACFFIGKPKSLAIAVWEGSGWSGLHSWETLLNKCLVESYEAKYDRCNKEDCIWMHDHLRDMGRQIAYRHSPYRLENPDEILNIQKKFQERILVRGIADSIYDFLPFKKHMLQNEGNSRRRLKCSRSSLGLKILHVESNQFTEEFSSLLEDLVWLRWNLSGGQRNLPSWLYWILSWKQRNLPLWLCWILSWRQKNLPSWPSLKNLRVLELRNTNQSEELWEDNVEPPLQLRELRITQSRRLERLPRSIGYLKHLKKIILSSGFGGSSLPEEFCDLQSLEHLELPESGMLSSLPSGFGELISLRHIDLRYSKQLRMLPNSFKKLVNLEYMDLECCGNLSFRLDMLENMTKLEFLNLSYCQKLDELPQKITNQASLRDLYINGCINLMGVPVNIGTLCKLETLTIGSPLLTSLPTSLGNLSSLNTLTIKCPLLTSLPISLGNLSSLNTLQIECSLLTSLPCSLSNLSFLTTLDILNCAKLERLPHSMGRLNLLRRLKIMLSAVRELPFAAGSSSAISEISVCQVCCPAPQTPSLVANAHLMDIGMLPISLNSVILYKCEMLKNIKGVGGLPNLHELQITCCPELDKLPRFADLASLKVFLIERCPKVGKIEGLEHCTSLQKINIYDCHGLDGLPSFVNLSSLKLFVMQGCSKVEKIEGLDHCESLQVIDIDDCDGLDGIEGLKHCRSLQELYIFNCWRLDGLPSFKNLASLKAFEIHGCPKVDKIEGLEHCMSLTALRVYTCWKVPGIESLRSLEGLKKLELKCNTISALKPCIQSMKECPREMWISGRVARFGEPIVQSFEFPDLTVMRLENSSQWHNFRELWRNAESARHLPHWSKGPFLWYAEEIERYDRGESGSVFVRESDKPDRSKRPFLLVEDEFVPFVRLGLCQRRCRLYFEDKFLRVKIFVSTQDSSGFWPRMKIEIFHSECEGKAMLVRGGGGRVVEAFYQLLALLE